MVNKIVMSMVYFDDILALTHCLPSVIPWVDEAIAIDGAYKGYPVDHDLSNDGSTQFIKSSFEKADKPVTFISPIDRWTEVQKRSAYFDYMDKHYDWDTTWMLIWDADWELIPETTMEEMVKDFNMMRTCDSSINILRIPLTNGFGRETITSRADHGIVPCGYHACPGLEVKNNHFSVYEKHSGREVRNVYPYIQLGRTRIVNRMQLKTDERIEQRAKYVSQVIRKYEP